MYTISRKINTSSSQSSQFGQPNRRRGRKAVVIVDDTPLKKKNREAARKYRANKETTIVTLRLENAKLKREAHEKTKLIAELHAQLDQIHIYWGSAGASTPISTANTWSSAPVSEFGPISGYFPPPTTLMALSAPKASDSPIKEDKFLLLNLF